MMVVPFLSLCVGALLFGQFASRPVRDLILNPSYHLAVWSWFYLMLPAATGFVPDFGSVSVSPSSRVLGAGISVYFSLVHLLFFFLSMRTATKREIVPDVPALTIKMVKPIAYLLFVFTLALLLLYGPSFVGDYSDRVAVAERYSRVFQRYRLSVVTNALIVGVAAVSFRTGTIKPFVLMSPLVILELLSNGKSETFRIAIALVMVAALLKKTISRKLIVVAIGSLLATGMVRAGPSLSGFAQLFGEFFVTYFAGLLTIDHFSNSGDLLNYISHGFFSIFPSSLREVVAPLRDDHVKTVVDFTGFGFHVMSNPLGESFYYGGQRFAMIQPWLISSLYLSVTLMVRSGRLFFVLLGILMTQYVQTGFRIGLLRNVFIFIPFLLLYFCWIWWIEMIRPNSKESFHQL